VVEAFVEQNKTETEILTELEKWCKAIPIPSWASECVSIVATSGPDIIKLVIAKENATVVCQQVGLCSQLVRVPHHKYSLRPVHSTFKTPSSPHTSSKKPSLTKKPEAPESVECSVCTYLVGYAEQYVKENRTETQILSALDDVCKALGIQSWVKECQTMVNAEGPMIIDLLEKAENPDTICSQIGFCSSASRVKVNAVVVAAQKPAQKPVVAAQKPQVPPSFPATPSTTECTLCETLVGQAEQLLLQTKTENEIIHDLLKVCTAIPVKSVSQTCSSIVSADGAAIIQYLVQQYPPAALCTTLKLC